MINELINLPHNSMISIDDAVIKNMVSKQDFKILSSSYFEYENSRIAVLDFNGLYHLVIIEILNDLQYFFCEHYDEGKRYFNRKEDQFYPEIKLKIDSKPTFYENINEFISDLDDQPSFAQYKSDDYYSSMIVKKTLDEIISLRGVEISETSIVI